MMNKTYLLTSEMRNIPGSNDLSGADGTAIKIL